MAIFLHWVIVSIGQDGPLNICAGSTAFENLNLP